MNTARTFSQVRAHSAVSTSIRLWKTAKALRAGMATAKPQKVVTREMEMSSAMTAGSGMAPAARIEANSRIIP